MRSQWVGRDDLADAVELSVLKQNEKASMRETKTTKGWINGRANGEGRHNL
jgi:hypothetical protein